jgi:hypothetical protein
MGDSQSGAMEPPVAKKRRKSGSENRKDKRVRTLRLSDRQDAELVKNAEAAGISVGGFIRWRCCTQQDIKPRKLIPVEVHELIRLRGQVSKFSSNVLNQIVRRENFGENLYAEDYRRAIAGADEMLATIHALLRDAHRKMRG